MMMNICICYTNFRSECILRKKKSPGRNQGTCEYYSQTLSYESTEGTMLTIMKIVTLVTFILQKH